MAHPGHLVITCIFLLSVYSFVPVFCRHFVQKGLDETKHELGTRFTRYHLGRSIVSDVEKEGGNSLLNISNTAEPSQKRTFTIEFEKDIKIPFEDLLEDKENVYKQAELAKIEKEFDELYPQKTIPTKTASGRPCQQCGRDEALKNLKTKLKNAEVSADEKTVKVFGKELDMDEAIAIYEYTRHSGALNTILRSVSKSKTIAELKKLCKDQEVTLAGPTGVYVNIDATATEEEKENAALKLKMLQAQLMQNGLKKLTPHPSDKPLYRMEKFYPTEAETMKRYEVGKIIEMDAFTSTNDKLPPVSMKDRPLKITIYTKYAAEITALNFYSQGSEEEILIMARRKFKVTENKKDPKDSKKYLIELRDA